MFRRTLYIQLKRGWRLPFRCRDIIPCEPACPLVVRSVSQNLDAVTTFDPVKLNDLCFIPLPNPDGTMASMCLQGFGFE